jgi:hypothetical protein
VLDTGSVFTVRIPVIISIFLLGCASPKVIEERQVGDESLSCAQIKEQIAEADRFEEAARDDKGVTGTNAAALLFFWPALLFTYDNIGDAMDAASERKRYLHGIYSKNTCDSKSLVNSEKDKELSVKLAEFNNLYKQGVLTEEEYKAAKRKALGL